MRKGLLVNIVAVSVVLWALFGWKSLELIGYEIDWPLAGKIAVVWIVVAVVASPFIGNLLYKLRTRREFEEHLARERRRVRLTKLVDLADEYDSARSDKERLRILKKATDLGFTDDACAFMLDENEQPHLPRAS